MRQTIIREGWSKLNRRRWRKANKILTILNHFKNVFFWFVSKKRCWPSFKFLWICHDKSKEWSHWSEPVVQIRNEDPVSLQASALTGPEMVETGLSHALHRGEGGTKGGTKGAQGGGVLSTAQLWLRGHTGNMWAGRSRVILNKLWWDRSWADLALHLV